MPSMLAVVAAAVILATTMVGAVRRSHITGYEEHLKHQDTFGRNMRSEHVDDHFKFCNICKTALAPVIKETIESASGADDAKTVIDEALSQLSRTHFYSLDDRAAKRRDEASDVIDEEIHAFIESLQYEVSTSRGLYALFAVWHEFPANRRTHFDMLVEHVVCVCHHDRLMRLPSDRLHKYLQDFESALSGSLQRYGGHPADDPALRWEGDAEPHPYAGSADSVPHVHEDLSSSKHRVNPHEMKIMPHEHVPGQPGMGQMMGSGGDL